MSMPEILLKGSGIHSAKFSDSALGTIRSIEHTVQSLDEVAASLEQEMKDTRKRITDLTAQCGQPFEYADRLNVLVARQQEIAERLDLTKNQASSQLESESPAESPASREEAAAALREMGFPEYEY
jgi:chromosome segregation ATPase